MEEREGVSVFYYYLTDVWLAVFIKVKKKAVFPSEYIKIFQLVVACQF